MNPLKYALAKAMVKRSVQGSDFDPVQAETNFFADTSAPDYNNSYYFTGHDNDGKAVIIRLALRGTGAVELWFSLYIPGIGSYSVPAGLQQGLNGFNDGPLKLSCIDPVKKWRIRFSGEVIGDSGPCRAGLDAVLTSPYPLFHFTNDMDPSAMARALASEKWTREFFSTLKNMHQHHYEQGGSLKGNLSIEGRTFDLSMKFFRDHSYGPRSWAAMDRHIWLCACLDNGDYINLSLPEYPFIKITAGFYGSNGACSSVVRSSAFADIAPCGLPERDFTYQITLDTGKSIDIRCSRGTQFSWLMGDAYRVIEWVSEFDVKGVQGRGICETGFNIRKFNYENI